MSCDGGPNLTQLPSELIEAIASHFPSVRDVSILSRAHPSLHRILEPFLYRHNVRHEDGSALLDGIVNDDISTVEKALSLGGADLDMTWSTGDHRLRTRRFLRNKGADMTGRSRAYQIWRSYVRLEPHRFSPLGFAVLYDRPGMVRYLLDHGAAPSQGFLHVAAHLGHDAVVSVLLSHDAYHQNPCGVDTNAGKQPLKLAIAGGHVETVQLLLEHDPKAARRLAVEFTETTSISLECEELLVSLAKVEQEAFETLVLLLNSHGAEIHRWQGGYWGKVTLCSAASQYAWKLHFLHSNGLATTLEARTEARNAYILHEAASQADVKMVRYLLNDMLEDGAIVEDDNMRRTVLDAAVLAGRGGSNVDRMDLVAVVRAILKHPAAKNLVEHHVSSKYTRKLVLGPLLCHLTLAEHGPWSTLDGASGCGCDGAQCIREEHQDYGPQAEGWKEQAHPTHWWCAQITQAFLDAGVDITASCPCRCAGAASHPRGFVEEALKRGCIGCAEVLIADLEPQRGLQILTEQKGMAEDAARKCGPWEEGRIKLWLECVSSLLEKHKFLGS